MNPNTEPTATASPAGMREAAGLAGTASPETGERVRSRFLRHRRPLVRRADHHGADDGLPRTEVPQTGILSAGACRFPPRSSQEVHT